LSTENISLLLVVHSSQKLISRDSTRQAITALVTKFYRVVVTLERTCKIREEPKKSQKTKDVAKDGGKKSSRSHCFSFLPCLAFCNFHQLTLREEILSSSIYGTRS
jgi:hypothetical protein